MAGGAAEISLPPYEIQKLEHFEEVKKMAYLRDAGLCDLLPIESNKRFNPDGPLLEGSAAPFLMELFKELQKALVREIRLFLESEGRGDLAKSIESIEMLPLDLQIRFVDKGWHLNGSNDVGGLDDYQLLCLGNRDKVDDPITEFCNEIGNALWSDLAYVGFCKEVFMKLQLNGTEYVGFQRAAETNNLYHPSCRMKHSLIPWIINVWITYKFEEHKLQQRVALHLKLWNSVVDEKNEFSEALYEDIKHNLDPSIKSDFKSVIKYVQQRLSEIKWMKPDILVDEYFKKLRPVMRLDNGYAVYLKEKITKAMQLGIIKKEDEEAFAVADKILQDIEHTDLHSWDRDSWFRC